MKHSRLFLWVAFCGAILVTQQAWTPIFNRAEDNPVVRKENSGAEEAPLAERHRDQLLFDRDRAVERSLNVLKQRRRDDHVGEPLFDAVYVLWIFKPRSAIPLLSKHIAYEPLGYQAGVGAGPTYAHFLAASVLVDIGTPVIPEMLKLISDPNRTELELRLACWVLLRIEANGSDLQPHEALEEDFVKETVLRRLECLDFTNERDWVQKYECVANADDFVRSFADTDERRQEIPEILGKHLLPLATAGVTIHHQFPCKPPQNHPKASLKFVLDEEVEQELGIHLSESGELTGAPKKPGMHKIAVNVRATFDEFPYGTQGRRIFSLCVRDPQE